MCSRSRCIYRAQLALNVYRPDDEADAEIGAQDLITDLLLLIADANGQKAAERVLRMARMNFLAEAKR
jgi:hypothetical protein